MDAAEYHAHSALSHSQLEDLLRSPSLYHGRHIARTLYPPADTLSTALGTGLHCATLEGRDVFDERFCVWRGGLTKGGKPTTNRNSQAYKDFAASLGGRAELDEDDERAIAEMLGALAAHKDAAQLLWGTEGVPEHSLFWRERDSDDEHGTIEARCRLDRVMPSIDFIIDLKTARDVSPKGRAKAIADYGYHRKAEWYRRGYVANYGRPLREFLLIWIQNEPPYDVAVSRVGAVAEHLAAAEIDRALDDLVRRRRANDWRPSWCVDVQVDELPAWAVDRDLLQEVAQ